MSLWIVESQDYFDDDDDDEQGGLPPIRGGHDEDEEEDPLDAFMKANGPPTKKAATAPPAPQEEEVDPLDAFMANVSKEVSVGLSRTKTEQ